MNFRYSNCLVESASFSIFPHKNPRLTKTLCSCNIFTTYKILKRSTKDLQEEEEKASPGRFKAANQHVTKIISSLPDHSPSRQSSLSEILAPQARLASC